MTLAETVQHTSAGDAFGTMLLVLFVGGGLVAGVIGIVRLTGSARSDVHVSGQVQHEVTGRIAVEHTGTVRQEVEHRGTVNHVHELSQEDRERLDQANARAALDAAERARVERLDLTRKLDALEASRHRVIDAEVVRSAIERAP